MVPRFRLDGGWSHPSKHQAHPPSTTESGANGSRSLLRRGNRGAGRGDRGRRDAQPPLRRAGADRPPLLAGGPLPAAELGLRRRRSGGRLCRRSDGPLRLRRRLRRRRHRAGLGADPRPAPACAAARGRPLRRALDRRPRLPPPRPPPLSLPPGPALFVDLSIAVLGSSLLALGPNGPDIKPGFGAPAAIGTLLLERLLLAFEVS